MFVSSNGSGFSSPLLHVTSHYPALSRAFAQFSTFDHRCTFHVICATIPADMLFGNFILVTIVPHMLHHLASHILFRVTTQELRIRATLSNMFPQITRAKLIFRVLKTCGALSSLHRAHCCACSTCACSACAFIAHVRVSLCCALDHPFFQSFQHVPSYLETDKASTF